MKIKQVLNSVNTKHIQSQLRDLYHRKGPGRKPINARAARSRAIAIEGICLSLVESLFIAFTRGIQVRKEGNGLSSMFKEIDQLFSEELPLGYFIMLTGPPSFGKGTFVAQYAFQGVLKNEMAVYLVTDSHPSEVRSMMLRFGWDVEPYEKEGLFRFIDGYSWRFGGPFEEKYYISDPKNLTNVMIEINKALKDVKSPARIIFDSFSSIGWMSSTITAIRFLQSLDGKINKEGYKGIYTVEEGMHDSITMATLRAQADGIFELKIVEEEDGLHRFFRIFNIRGIPSSTIWVPMSITNKGFEFK